MRARPSPRLVLMAAALVALAAVPMPDLEESVTGRVNEIRRESGLTPLTADRRLAELAREHSCRMARERALGHDTGGSLADRVRAAGIKYRSLAENLARLTGGTGQVERAVSGWMKSDGHRANILSPEFNATGVGVCRQDAAVYVTQLFVRPR